MTLNLDELDRLAKAATPGPWSVDSFHNEGAYGNGPHTSEGFNSYAVGCGPDSKWKTIVDTLNSDIATVEIEYDEGQTHAWDEVGRPNTTYIVAACNALPELVAEIRRLQSEMRLQKRIAEMSASIIRDKERTKAHGPVAVMVERIARQFDRLADKARLALGEKP